MKYEFLASLIFIVLGGGGRMSLPCKIRFFIKIRSDFTLDPSLLNLLKSSRNAKNAVHVGNLGSLKRQKLKICLEKEASDIYTAEYQGQVVVIKNCKGENIVVKYLGKNWLNVFRESVAFSFAISMKSCPAVKYIIIIFH